MISCNVKKGREEEIKMKVIKTTENGCVKNKERKVEELIRNSHKFQIILLQSSSFLSFLHSMTFLIFYFLIKIIRNRNQSDKNSVNELKLK
jgi:hypothetical protein